MVFQQKTNRETFSRSIRGHYLSVRTYGDVQGQPLLLIHGYGNSGHIWQYMLPYLATQCHLFIVDLPGFGQSRLNGPWQLKAMAPLLSEWLQEMQIGPITVLGHSMGGAIAIHLAAVAPQQINKLILISAAGMPLQANLPYLTIRSVRSFFQRKNGHFPLPLLLDALKLKLPLLWQIAQEMKRSDLRTELNDLKMPTLIVWGEQDRMLPITLGYALRATLPHASFVTIPDCGHRPMLAQPEQLSQIVLNFMSASVDTKGISD